MPGGPFFQYNCGPQEFNPALQCPHLRLIYTRAYSVPRDSKASAAFAALEVEGKNSLTGLQRHAFPFPPAMFLLPKPGMEHGTQSVLHLTNSAPMAPPVPPIDTNLGLVVQPIHHLGANLSGADGV